MLFELTHFWRKQQTRDLLRLLVIGLMLLILLLSKTLLYDMQVTPYKDNCHVEDEFAAKKRSQYPSELEGLKRQIDIFRLNLLFLKTVYKPQLD